MRRFIRIAIVLLIAPLIGFALAVPASAGGPTSVAVFNAGSWQATALHATSESYDELANAIGELSDQTHALSKAPSSAALGGQEGRQVTATWMIHDVQVWRVDRIHLDTRDGRPLILRSLTDLSGREAKPTQTWLRAADPEGLRQLLAQLKVDGKQPAQGAGKGGGEATGQPAAAQPDKASDPRAATPDTDAATGWWWALPGAAAGALLVWVSLRARPRTGVEGRSRWELLDVSEPDEPGPGEQPDTWPAGQPTGRPGAG
ncbi:hypothetical protein G5C51_39800 [Streptomyces sp. A7024]|uniref:Secreted protein n=1 Tax=Streptomyces coryli TaxID=1128680 RepID=A0A6G4UE48_9ACTN|nr:hypothetical protein [Streptomyces coryli]NGN70020.1 hypothetical protein [Streptomyces coryli]